MHFNNVNIFRPHVWWIAGFYYIYPKLKYTYGKHFLKIFANDHKIYVCSLYPFRNWKKKNLDPYVQQYGYG